MASVNLGGGENSAAHAKVLSGELTWACFSLPPNNELRLQGTGDSIDDLTEEFEDGRIQFGFLRVIDPISKLARFVLIQWCGEGVPESRKGLFSSHASTVASRLLKGSHVTIQARQESDLDTNAIMKRVSNASGSKYSVHNEPAQKMERPAPVGSSYVPVGRPDIAAMSNTARKPEAPAPVGTAYESKRNELADIRAGRQMNAPIPSAPRPAQASSSLARPGYSAKPPSPVTSPPVSAVTAHAATPPIPSTNAHNKMERPEPVGTAYTPVSLPKPGKLGNRFPFGQQAEAQPAAVHTPTRQAGPGLTWSQRQEQAKLQREQEDAQARQALSSDPVAPPAPQFAARPPAPAIVPSVIRAPTPPLQQPEPESPVEEPQADFVPPPPPPPPPPPAPPAASGAALGAKLADQEADHRHLEEQDAVTQQTAKLDQLKVAEQSAHRAAAQGQRAVALYEYVKDEENEIGLTEGEEIFNVEQVSDDWWQAERATGEVGLFPSNYVQLLDPSLDGPSSGQAEPEDVEVSAVPAPPPPPPAPSAPAHPLLSEPEPAEAEVEQGAPQGNPPFATALYDYVADEENEISFAEGERISDIEFSDEAWFTGSNAAGLRGLFPSNYVQLDDFIWNRKTELKNSTVATPLISFTDLSSDTNFFKPCRRAVLLHAPFFLSTDRSPFR